jgi:hypothetical protein
MQNDQEKRLAWTTPVLKRIYAGSAEANDNSGGADGGKGSTDKS